MTTMQSPMKLDTIRKDILAAEGHLLIEGGPGCGKTTIALLKARRTMETLGPEQRTLFLSFSRAAVRQIADRMNDVFDRTHRDKIEIRTFHSFFLDLVRSHGRLLTGKPSSFISPDRESQLRADFDGDWKQETRRLAREDARYVFDLLAKTAATLLERSSTIRDLYSDTYPVIIVDEFQDTNTDQWRAVRALSSTSAIVCLADPDQRIFDHIEGVDEARISEAIDLLHPARFDLSNDNHRSSGGGLLDYANAVLRGDSSHPVPDTVRTGYYKWPVRCETKVHHAIVVLNAHLDNNLGRVPKIAVLARVNALVGRISETISSDTTIAGTTTLPAIDHQLHWDPDLSAAAGYVVASMLEWPGLPRDQAIPKTLQAVADFYRVKLDGELGPVDRTPSVR